VQRITRTYRLAAGVFAPGHLGELTQQVPFEMVDAVLAETGAAQRRVRELPSRVVVYLLLAGCLFSELGYRQVWQRLTAGLAGLAVPDPSETALTKARRRVGPNPLRALFDLLRGPAATTRTAAGVLRWRGLLVCAIDGTIMTVADSPANLARYRKQRGGATGGSSYPLLRLVALVACGTRSLIDASFGPVDCGETRYAARLVASARAGMLILADRKLRCRLPGSGDRRRTRRCAGAGQDRPGRADATGAAPASRRLLPLHLRRQAGTGHRRPDHDRHRCRRQQRPVPVGDHPARPAPLSGAGADPALPPAMGCDVRSHEFSEHIEEARMTRM
jgi:hypothetical protein